MKVPDLSTLTKGWENATPAMFKAKDCLLYVRPYWFPYTTRCKGNWEGRNLYQVLCESFPYFDTEYFQLAFNKGRIFVNSTPVDMEYICCAEDLIVHLKHRHEVS